MTPNADDSARILTEHIRKQEPFLFLRYGDGFLETFYKMRPGSMTCDGEPYADWLGHAMADAWLSAVTLGQDGAKVYVGDWLTASFDGPATHVVQWRALLGEDEPNFLHFEALLPMRDSEAVVDFYRAVKQDPRRKLYMGPEANAGAAAMLGAMHAPVRMGGLDERWVDWQTDLLLKSDFDVLLFGAGMAGCIPVIRCWLEHPERSYVHIGSGLDPLFRGKSRTQQLPKATLQRMFKDLL